MSRLIGSLVLTTHVIEMFFKIDNQQKSKAEFLETWIVSDIEQLRDYFLFSQELYQKRKHHLRGRQETDLRGDHAGHHYYQLRQAR